MSQVYSKEPNTTGQVVLNTTCGPIEIHLFCKECPTTTRAFIQSCLDGYYDNLPFHRVLDNVLIQTGQREVKNSNINSNNRGNIMDDQEYNKSFHGMWERSEERDKYEIISRIQFNHRGQLALARSVNMTSEEKIALRGQFFITLDSTPWLNNEHVILGTIGTSPTVFNALRIGRSIVVDEKTNPTPIDLDSVKIINVSVKSNLFENELVPNSSVPWLKKDETSSAAATAKKKKEKKRKRLLSKKNINVLSFGDEEGGMEEDEFELSSSSLKKKIFSKKLGITHDLVSNDKNEETMKNKKRAVVGKGNKDITISSNAKNDTMQVATKVTINSKSNAQFDVTSDKNVGECKKEVSNKEQEENAENDNNMSVEQDLLVVTKTRQSSTTAKTNKQEEEDKDNISGIVEARRSRYISSTKSHRRGDKKGRKDESDDIFNKLSAFRSRIIKAKSSKQKPQQNSEEYKGQILDKSDDEEDDKNITTTTNDATATVKNNNWMKSKFSNCKKHMDHESRIPNNSNSRRDNIDDYVVIDDKHKNDNHHHHRRSTKKRHRKKL